MAAQARRAFMAVALLVGTSQAAWAAGPAAGKECTAKADMPYQIRAADCRVAEAVASGLTHSARFRQLVDRVGELKGIVYVDARHIVQPDTRRVIDGTLQHRVVKAGEYRLLYVTVAPGREDTHIALLAHELQHAIEVLESNATTDADVERLFERIGTEARARAYETEAALQAQETVAKELAADRR